jgi:hypothetical protein
MINAGKANKIRKRAWKYPVVAFGVANPITSNLYLPAERVQLRDEGRGDILGKME